MRQGWAWWELKDVNAPRVDLDALRLLAVFLAHWDNKADNQRLVCMEAVRDECARRAAIRADDPGPRRHVRTDESQRVAMAHDANLDRPWSVHGVDAARCRIAAATFVDAQI